MVKLRQGGTPGILIARSLVKPDKTENVPIRVANILDQAITLQTNTLLGKLTPVAWVARMTQQRSSASDNSKLPEELQELLNRSFNLLRGEVKELRWFLHEFKNSSPKINNFCQELLRHCLLYTSRCV